MLQVVARFPLLIERMVVNTRFHFHSAGSQPTRPCAFAEAWICSTGVSHALIESQVIHEEVALTPAWFVPSVIHPQLHRPACLRVFPFHQSIVVGTFKCDMLFHGAVPFGVNWVCREDTPAAGTTLPCLRPRSLFRWEPSWNFVRPAERKGSASPFA